MQEITQPYFPTLYGTELIRKLEKAINGEFSAIQCYEQLAKIAPEKAISEQIKEIRQDEIKHFWQFSQLYMQLTGARPQPKVTETCPDKYRDGLEFAFKDEQETVDFYLDVSDEAMDPFIRKTFRRAALDEQQHAVWFLYFFKK